MTPLHTVLDRLERVQRTGDGWKARCPAHDDRDPSLSIGEAEDGHVQVHCFAGCDRGAILAALRLDWRDLYPPRAQAARRVPREQREPPLTLEALADYVQLPADFLKSQGVTQGKRGVTIAYRLEDGSQAARHHRRYSLRQGKRFDWGGPHGASPVPYGLWHLEEARPGGRLILVEGESDVWTLWYRGMPALGIPGADMAKTLEAAHLEGFEELYISREPGRGGDTFVRGLRDRLQALGSPAAAAVFTLPGAKDPSDLYKRDPAAFLAVFTQALEQATPLDAAPTATAHPTARPVVVTMDSVEGKPVQWLWWPYMAVGKVCMLDGDPGLGKSLLMTQLAASLSRGYPLPDQQGKLTLDTGGPQHSLLLTAEEGLADTLKPHLDAAEADCSKIHVLTGWLGEDNEEHTFSLQHLDVLESALEQYRPRLVVIDPIQAYLGSVDMYRASETRPLLAALTKLAERHACAVVCVRHMTKPGKSEAKAIYRGMGSIDFIGAARTGLFVEADPTDSNKALLAQSKSNVGRFGRTQVFSKAEGVFRWCGVSRLTEKVLEGSGRGPDRHAFLDAFMWLERRLKPGVRERSKDIEREAKEEEGFSEDTLKRVKKALGVVSVRDGEQWFWLLPELPPLLPPETATTSSTSPTSSTSATSTPSLESIGYKKEREEVGGGQVGQVGEEGEVVGVPIEDRAPLVNAPPPGGALLPPVPLQTGEPCPRCGGTAWLPWLNDRMVCWGCYVEAEAEGPERYRGIPPAAAAPPKDKTD